MPVKSIMGYDHAVSTRIAIGAGLTFRMRNAIFLARKF